MLNRVESGPTLRLDKAIERNIADAPDAPTAVEMQGFQAVISGRDVRPEGIDPPGVIGALFTHIMPRISNPSILQLDRRQTLLQRLEARAVSRGDSAPVVPGGLESVRLELRNIEQLRRQRDSLIGG